MATLLTEWGTDLATTGLSSIVVNVPSTLPVGTLVVASLCCSGVTGSFTIADSGGNTWTSVQGNNSAQLILATSRLTTQLTSASTVTFTVIGPAAVRHTTAFAAFSDTTSGTPTNGTINETVSTPVIGGTVTPSATSLVVGCTGFVNSGRVFTPGAGWTPGVKHLSTVGSGDRAVQLVWRDGVASTPYAQIGTLASSGTNDTVLMWVATGGGGPGWFAKPVKVWTGSVWKTCPVKVWSGSAWVTKPTKVYQ